MKRLFLATGFAVGVTFGGLSAASAAAECIVQTDAGCVQDVRPPSVEPLPQFKSFCEITGVCPIAP